MGFNFALSLMEASRRSPEKTAIIFDDYRLSYKDFYTEAKKFTDVLHQLEIEPGSHITLMLPNVPAFAFCYFGILIHGSVTVPINVLYKEPEISFRLENSGSQIIVVWHSFMEEAQKSLQLVDNCHHMIVVGGEEVLDPGKNIYDFDHLMSQAKPDMDIHIGGADDPAVLMYTSGTTGIPKGAVLSHFSIFYQTSVLKSDAKIEVDPNDVGIAFLPLFHIFGLFNVLSASVVACSTFSLLPQFEPGKVLEVIERDRVTHMSGVPTMFIRLLNHPDFHTRDLSSLKRCGTGGASMPVEAHEAWERHFGFTVDEGYGMTETGSGVCSNYNDRVETRFGSVGQLLWGVEVRIIDDNDQVLGPEEVGEVITRSPGLMNGYYKRPDAEAKAFLNGWMRTGDLGKLDEDGYLYIVGRKKDMILRGGYNIFPRQIEEVLYEHEAVNECAVIGVPHPELGEEIKAVIYLKDGFEVEGEEFKHFCKERMAAIKYPRIVEITEEPLPKNATGKIMKRVLRETHEK